MKVLRLLIASSPRLALLATFAGLLSGVAHTGVLALVNHVIAVAGRPEVDVAILAGAFALLAIIKLVAQAWSQIILNRFSQRALAELRRGITRRILAAPLRRLETVGAPRLTAALTDDVLLIADAYRALPRMAVNAAVLVSCSVYLAWLSVEILAGVAVFALLGVLTYRLLLGKAIQSLRAAREVQDSLFGHFQSLIQGTKELKLHAGRRRAFLSEGIDAATTAFERHNTEASRRLALTFGWSQLIYFALIGLLIFLLPAMRDLDARTLTGYVVTTLYLMGPLTTVIDAIPTVGTAAISLGKIEALGLDLERAPERLESLPATPSAFERIAFEGVCFRYRDAGGAPAFSLGPLDLELLPGEILFVVGGNGSGKSTLSKLVTGLYAPDEGRVILDGRDVDAASREGYRQLFSTVFSDFWLFESFLGLDAGSIDERARHWLQRLDLDRKVRVEDGRFSSTALSQGQRKRLALLAARLEDRPIYVFDEWAADQDPEFKEIFYRVLLPELKNEGRCVMVISHDDRWFDVADRVVRLDSGKIVGPRSPFDDADPAGVSRK